MMSHSPHHRPCLETTVAFDSFRQIQKKPGVLTMTIFVSQGRYTHQAFDAMITNPEDRWENTRALIEAAGGRLLDFYITYGAYDFLMICEAPSAERLAPALLAASATGGITGLTTYPAMTTAEAKTAFEGAQLARSTFRPATG